MLRNIFFLFSFHLFFTSPSFAFSLIKCSNLDDAKYLVNLTADIVNMLNETKKRHNIVRKLEEFRKSTRKIECKPASNKTILSEYKLVQTIKFYIFAVGMTPIYNKKSQLDVIDKLIRGDYKKINIHEVDIYLRKSGETVIYVGKQAA